MNARVGARVGPVSVSSGSEIGCGGCALVVLSIAGLALLAVTVLLAVSSPMTGGIVTGIIVGVVACVVQAIRVARRHDRERCEG